MKYLNISFLLTFLLLTTPAYALEFTGTVDRVIDGDTVKIKLDDKTERVRLFGIDSPELKKKYGQQAKDFVKSQLEGKTVKVIWQERDKYKRIVGTIYLGETNINHLIVAEGWAKWYRFFAPDDKELERLEKQARKAKKGIWAKKTKHQKK